MLPEHALIGDVASGGGVVEGDDALLGRVGEVHGFPVQRPADTVRYCQRGAHGVTGEIRVESEKRP